MTLDTGDSGSLGGVSCILNGTDAPEHIRDGLTARWTNDADSGLQITFIEEN